MATIKLHTDIKQSKKLAEILPIKSADMKWFVPADNEGEFIEEVSFIKYKSEYILFEQVTDWNDTPYIPCWSLAALLNVLPNGSDVVKEETDTENEKYMCTVGVRNDIISTFAINPVDACYEMILKLHEFNLL